ncbi:hypothetical protein ILUMI_15869 [Ignelater luminosus]|uniref:Uncharacterized protein n=1 Tax=Ignelater luminosus TaxID=2038154 RepID=A0A8K0CMS4_IGNLU|nr:hypothetical protein ILUMI_15869 [Ignelater luminosus]
MEMGKPRGQNRKEYVIQTNTRMAAVERKKKQKTSEDEVERRHSKDCGRGTDEKSGRTTGVEEYEGGLYPAVGMGLSFLATLQMICAKDTINIENIFVQPPEINTQTYEKSGDEDDDGDLNHFPGR